MQQLNVCQVESAPEAGSHGAGYDYYNARAAPDDSAAVVASEDAEGVTSRCATQTSCGSPRA